MGVDCIHTVCINWEAGTGGMGEFIGGGWAKEGTWRGRREGGEEGHFDKPERERMTQTKQKQQQEGLWRERGYKARVRPK